MSRQVAAIVATLVIGLTGLAVWSARARPQALTAGFWFEDVTGDATAGFPERFGGPITSTELTQIEAIALAELKVAFSNTRLAILDSPPATYRVRVVRELAGGPRSVLPVAGGSRLLPGGRGDGAVNFSVIASSAIGFAPAHADRQTILDGIGRGVGRSAAHELAHQILCGFPLHNTTDRMSYEFADLRSEHFYRDVHWSVALVPLQNRIGPRSSPGPGLE